MARTDDLLADLHGVYREGLCIRCNDVHERQWFTPMGIGASDASHHSATLTRLVKRGDVIRRERGGLTRPSYMYRCVGAELCPREQ